MLAERIDELLDELMTAAPSQGVIPAVAPLDLDDDGPLDQPIEEEFRAGTMTLSWDAAEERVVIEVFPFTEAAVVAPDQLEEDIEEPEPDEVFLVRIPPGVARAFVKRAAEVLGAGRPDLPVLRQPDRPRRPPVRAGQRVPPPRPVSRPRPPRATSSSRPDHAGLQRDLPGRSTAGSSTSRSPGSGRCGTSPTARWPGARWRRTPSPRRCGWAVVPTDLPGRGPHGPGMVQVWREPDPSRRRSTWCPPGPCPGYLRVDASTPRPRVSLVHEDTVALRRMAVFDVVVNNADRKGGHVLAMPDGHRYGVDHGVSFHVENKAAHRALGLGLGDPLPTRRNARRPRCCYARVDGDLAGRPPCSSSEEAIAASSPAASASPGRPDAGPPAGGRRSRGPPSDRAPLPR